MSKKNGKVKETILARVAVLLEKFSERLVRVARETRQNTDTIAALQDNVRLKVGGLAQAIETGIEKVAERQRAQSDYAIKGVIERVSRVEKESADRENKQITRDQNNVQALVNLRDSTAKAFNQVKDDVSALLVQIQRLNERTGQVESKHDIILERAITAVDQSIVNSKLSGVYDVTADLDRRLQELEAEIALVTEFRRAQAAFILGPTKKPTTLNEPKLSGNFCEVQAGKESA